MIFSAVLFGSRLEQLARQPATEWVVAVQETANAVGTCREGIAWVRLTRCGAHPCSTPRVQNRSATVVTESPNVLYELTARNLYTYYKADIYAYAMVMQNINRELCRRLRCADNRIAELADALREQTRRREAAD